jgi:hypothetical protein
MLKSAPHWKYPAVDIKKINIMKCEKMDLNVVISKNLMLGDHIKLGT